MAHIDGANYIVEKVDSMTLSKGDKLTFTLYPTPFMVNIVGHTINKETNAKNNNESIEDAHFYYNRRYITSEIQEINDGISFKPCSFLANKQSCLYSFFCICSHFQHCLNVDLKKHLHVIFDVFSLDCWTWEVSVCSLDMHSSTTFNRWLTRN